MNWENGIDQNVTPPNLDVQNEENNFQNVPLPAQNAPLPEPKKPLKKVYIIISVAILFLLIICIVCVAIFITRGDGTIDKTNSDSSDNASEPMEEDVIDDNSNMDDDSSDTNDGNNNEYMSSVMDIETFRNMTKAEAIDFLQAGRGTAGSMPKNYVGEEITDLVIVKNNVVLSDVSLKYSHDTIDDLRQIAEKWYGVLGHNDGITEDDYKIKEYDYYAIITPNRIEETNSCDQDYYGDCKSLLSFKRNYINYFKKEITPNSFSDVTYLNTQNPELVERLLRIYSFFSGYGVASGHGNIYGSSFEEQSDKFVLTVYYVGVGLNAEKLKVDGSDIDYAINLYSRQYAADKADGRLYMMQAEENSTIENVKSIPITKKEASSLFSR